MIGRFIKAIKRNWSTALEEVDNEERIDRMFYSLSYKDKVEIEKLWKAKKKK